MPAEDKAECDGAIRVHLNSTLEKSRSIKISPGAIKVRFAQRNYEITVTSVELSGGIFASEIPNPKSLINSL